MLTRLLRLLPRLLRLALRGAVAAPAAAAQRPRRRDQHLPPGQVSGLQESKQILTKISDIKIVTLEAGDVIRHPIVAKIIKAYDRKNKN